MRKAAPLCLAIVVGMVSGCATMRSRNSHPGITVADPNAITREFRETSTQVARTLADVMSDDSIIDNVSMTPDAKSREYRNFTKAERDAIGISLLTLANDVNYNITARSKDGHPITVAVRLKGDSGCEVSILYGSSGDPALSRDLLDKTQDALARSKDPALIKASGSRTATAPKAGPR